MRRVLGVIPARLESSRIAHKVLRSISGHPMIAWVYRRARQAPGLDDLLVATDSEEIAGACRQYSIPVMMTSSEHRSGTDRLVEVTRHQAAEIYVNIQGDEPIVTPEHIELLLDPFRRLPGLQVSTLKVAIAVEEARDPNNVKVVTDCEGYALYFSRAPIPFSTGSSNHGAHTGGASGNGRYYKHLGLYAYTAAALERFTALHAGELEQQEKLEQLRFLENGIRIAVAETALDTIGVDAEEDFLKVEEFFRRTNAVLP